MTAHGSFTSSRKILRSRKQVAFGEDAARCAFGDDFARRVVIARSKAPAVAHVQRVEVDLDDLAAVHGAALKGDLAVGDDEAASREEAFLVHLAARPPLGLSNCSCRIGGWR